MKVKFDSWRDTGNVDMTLLPENEVDKALLVVLRDRIPRWYEGSNGDGSEQIILEAIKKRK